jgi:hypothetical protein
VPRLRRFRRIERPDEGARRLALPPERVALVAGIGCSSRLPAYTRVYGFHGVHGRALPVATGLAVSRPELTVIATGGDGDGFSIGGNHFIHACRRNVNLTYLVMDNAVYGMTKGQASPTTETDWTGSRLAPQGTHQPPFRPLEMALAAGAPFVARGFSNAPNELARMIAEADRLSRFRVHPGAEPLHHLPARAAALEGSRCTRASRRPTTGARRSGPAGGRRLRHRHPLPRRHARATGPIRAAPIAGRDRRRFEVAS